MLLRDTHVEIFYLDFLKLQFQFCEILICPFKKVFCLIYIYLYFDIYIYISNRTTKAVFRVLIGDNLILQTCFILTLKNYGKSQKALEKLNLKNI